MEYLIAYFSPGEQIAYTINNSSEILTTIRTKLLVAGYTVQVDRNGMEFVNPINNCSVVII
jgi:hypothetical protein